MKLGPQRTQLPETGKQELVLLPQRALEDTLRYASSPGLQDGRDVEPYGCKHLHQMVAWGNLKLKFVPSCMVLRMYNDLFDLHKTG